MTKLVRLFASDVRLSSALAAGALLSLSAVGCAAPTTPDDETATSEEQGSTEENTGKKAEALRIRQNPGGGGSSSTCISRKQSCYLTCGGAYPNDDRSRDLCEEICDDIYNECTGGVGGPGGGGVFIP